MNSLSQNLTKHSGKDFLRGRVWRFPPQRTSKCGNIINDTLGYATFRFLPHFDIISNLLQNRHRAYGIDLLSIPQHRLKICTHIQVTPLFVKVNLTQFTVLFPFLQGCSIPILWMVTSDLVFLLRTLVSIAVNLGTTSPSRLSVTMRRYISFCHF